MFVVHVKGVYFDFDLCELFSLSFHPSKIEKFYILSIMHTR